MLPLEIDLGALINDDNFFWITGIGVALPMVLMVLIVIAVVHGNRVRQRKDKEL